ncbi:MAG: hypothetical protein WDZ30_10825 [Cellvibrionaceae bacterium]
MSIEELNKCEPLSQVVFIHDYIQLVLQDCCVNVYNTSRITTTDGDSFIYGSSGFADNCVKLINHKVIAASLTEGVALTIKFENGFVFEVLLSPEYCSSPEAFEISGSPLTNLVIQQNA